MPLVRTRSLRFAILALIMTGACQRQDAEPAANQAETPANRETNIAEVLPLPAPAMDRAAFLAAVAHAASAHTAGIDDRKAQSELDGRRFAIRLRFGCSGPATSGSGEPLRWSISKDKASFEVRATPDLSLDSEPFEGSPSETIEAVEGFWLARPWLMDDACPAQRAGVPATAAAPAKLVGIAQYFTSQDLRVGQRSGRSYVSVEKICVGRRTARVRPCPAAGRAAAHLAGGQGYSLLGARVGPSAPVRGGRPSRPRGIRAARRRLRAGGVAELVATPETERAKPTGVHWPEPLARKKSMGRNVASASAL